MNTLEFCNNFEKLHQDLNLEDRMYKLRTELFLKGICWTDNKSGTDMTEFVAIFFLKKAFNDIDFNNPMVVECNGIVLHCDHSMETPWRLLVKPLPNATKTCLSIAQIGKYFQSGAYDVYETLDATIVNLYFDNQWRLSTNKAYDASNLCFCGSRTFLDVFNEIALYNNQNFSFDKLDTNNTYTIAIRFEEFHIFDETMNGRYVSEYDNSYLRLLAINGYAMHSTMSKETYAHIGIDPLFERSYIADRYNLYDTVNNIINRCKQSYQYFVKSRANNKPVKPLYGYVLRAKHANVPLPYRNIIFTSALFDIIRKALYTRPSDNLYQRIIYMHNDYRNCDKYKILFNNLSRYFDKLDAASTLIADSVEQMILNPNVEVIPLAKKIYLNILGDSSKENYSQAEKNRIRSVALDHLRSQEYVDLLASILGQ